MAVRRLAHFAFGAALMLSACGVGDEMSLAEYVERIDAVFEEAIQQYEALVTSPEGVVLVVGQGPHFGFDEQGAQLTDFTPKDLHRALERVAEIQDQALAAAATIEPPQQIAGLHALYFRELPIAELAARADTAADWQELSASPEMAAYRNALAADNQVCADFQAELDATAERGVFAASPWIPGELEDIVDYALGCDSLPENPEDAYRPPPPSP
jgi:2-hydroxychromene-2-carboxylate isomerase